MQIKPFTRCGVAAHLGLFLMGTLVGDLVITPLVASGRLPPQALPWLIGAVTVVNVLLYAMMTAFYLGFGLCCRGNGLLRLLGFLGAAVHLGNLCNALLLGGDYSLSTALRIVLFLAGFGVNIALLASLLGLYPRDRVLVITGLLGMLPFDTYCLFVALFLARLQGRQQPGWDGSPPLFPESQA